MSYWDTSALAKLFLTEADSGHFAQLARRAERLVTATIARLEALTVFRRREAEGNLSLGEAAALYAELTRDMALGRITEQSAGTLVEQEFARVLEVCFSQTPPIFIRTNDALHLASAIVAGETEFVTADLRQRAAAQAMGFIVQL